jgi:excisionase family DNA binding protein
LFDGRARRREYARVHTQNGPISLPDSRLAYSIPDASRLLSISRRHVYQLLSERKLKSIKLGSRRLIPRSELERLVAEGGE